MLKVEAFAFTLVFLLRRLMFAYVICYFDLCLVFQVLAIDAMSTAMLCYYVAN